MLYSKICISTCEPQERWRIRVNGDLPANRRRIDFLPRRSHRGLSELHFSFCFHSHQPYRAPYICWYACRSGRYHSSLREPYWSRTGTIATYMASRARQFAFRAESLQLRSHASQPSGRKVGSFPSHLRTRVAKRRQSRQKPYAALSSAMHSHSLPADPPKSGREI